MLEPRRRDPRRGRKLLLPLLVSPLLLGAFGAPGVAAVKNEAVVVLGKLPEPADAEASTTFLLDIDSRKERLLYLWRKGPLFFLRDYSISGDIPRLLREEQIGTYEEFQLDNASPYTVAIDDRKGLAYFIGPTYLGTTVKVVDIKKFEVVANWDLTGTAPGFFADGITYSAEDDRLYLFGGLQGEAHVERAATRRPASVSAVVALDLPKSKDEAATRAWLRPIAECQEPMSNVTVGALIVRSEKEPVLYFACVRPDPYPGESALIRLQITPDADQSAAGNFATEVFPISGSYTTNTEGLVGASAFDQKSQRFFIQSTSTTTPGTWVFDGRLSAWVGFIAAPDNDNRFLGLDETSGRFYMAGQDNDGSGSYLLATDGRATPIPQGTKYPGLGTAGFISVDPATDRLFVKMELSKLGLGKKTERGFVVVEDRAPDPKRPRPVDYDELTSKLPEGPNTVTSFSAGVNGFGARTVLVGGYAGLLSAAGSGAGPLRSGDRGMTASRLPSVDLRDVGASASAHSFVPDANTEAELSENGDAELPWKPISCLDGAGEGISNEDNQHFGYSSVECDLAKGIVKGTSSFGELESAGVSVAGSFITATAKRHQKLGTVTEVTAQAEGIDIPSEQGSLSVGRVVSFARTIAHGHPKTAKADWYRIISGVEVRDPNGEVVQSLAGCDSREDENSCGELERTINGLLPSKLRVELPSPRLLMTSGGAFAGVQQSDRDYYDNRTVNNQGAVFAGEEASRAVPALQVTVFNDNQEKSRLVLQLAAVQANSIYTISPETQPPGPEEGPVDLPSEPNVPPTETGAPSLGGGSVGDVSVPDIKPAGDVPAADDLAAPETVPVAAGPVDGALAFLRRSPQEALLVAFVWLTFAGAGWAIFRRHQLLKVLGGAKS